MKRRLLYRLRIDALEAKVGTVPESKTVVQMIEEAQEAATYDDTEIKAKVQANTNAIGVLNGEATVEGFCEEEPLLMRLLR